MPKKHLRIKLLSSKYNQELMYRQHVQKTNQDEFQLPTIIQRRLLQLEVVIRVGKEKPVFLRMMVSNGF